MIPFTLVICIVISAGSFAYGYQLAGYDRMAGWAIALGFFWLAAVWFKWRWYPTLAVLTALGLAAFGIWFEFIPGWMFSGAAFAFFAWDLSEFQRGLWSLPRREDIPGRTRRHVIRVFMLALAGMLLAFLLGWFRG